MTVCDELVRRYYFEPESSIELMCICTVGSELKDIEVETRIVNDGADKRGTDATAPSRRMNVEMAEAPNSSAG